METARNRRPFQAFAGRKTGIKFLPPGTLYRPPSTPLKIALRSVFEFATAVSTQRPYSATNQRSNPRQDTILAQRAAVPFFSLIVSSRKGERDGASSRATPRRGPQRTHADDLCLPVELRSHQHVWHYVFQLAGRKPGLLHLLNGAGTVGRTPERNAPSTPVAVAFASCCAICSKLQANNPKVSTEPCRDPARGDLDRRFVRLLL